MRFKRWQRSLSLTLAAVMVLAVALFVGSLAISAGVGKAAAAPACAGTHVVQRGETLSTIAQRYGVSVSQLAQANTLRNTDFIYAGQTLCLPSAGSSATQPQPGTICVEGYKVDDKHRGVPGFVIYAETKGTSLKAVTDKNGYFRFDNLTPGLWTFWEEVPRGWEPVTASKFQKELEYGYSGCYEIRFKNKPVPIPACLIVSKQDEAGSPLEGWEIKIKPKFGGTWASGVTDKGGQVRFDGLTPGKWLVKEVVPYAWEPKDPKTGEAEIELHPMADDQDCGKLVFINRRLPTGCVEGYKVDDQHRPLPGWEVCIYLNSAPAIQFCTKTDDQGYLRFDNLIFGEWIVWEKVQPGWTPVTAEKFPVTVDEERVCKQVRFKNRPPDLCAQGYKLDDKGFGVGGWKIRAWPEGHPDLVLQTVTEPNGHYRICGVTLGGWIFEEEHKVGWTATTGEQIAVDVTYPGPGKDVPAPTFRNKPPSGCIEGWKIDDREVGLPLWNITIQNVATGQTWHRWTDGTGYFQVCGLPMGKYLVWEELQSGWKPISPPKLEVSLEPSDEPIIAIVVFVNKQMERDICIDGYKKDIFDGAGLPNWEVKLLDLKGKVLATTTTDGTGYYRFSNLEAGTYVVEETMQEGWWPVSATSYKATVTFPPKFECVHVNFANRQKTTPPPCVTWHVVQKCETLSHIAMRYGVSVSAIMAANGLTDPNFIWVGQKLCIPDPS